MTSPIRLISFPGTGNLGIFAGQEKGLFAARGVEVALETTPSSMYQAQKLVAGEFDMACTAMDNVIAYQEGAGEVALDREPDLFIIASATQIEVSFVVAPEIDSYADLKGQRLALDALATACTRDLDRYSAAPDRAELDQRRAPSLTPRQEANLTRWGYPYVLDEFRFHLTLSGPLRTREEEALIATVTALAAPHLAPVLHLDDICLYGDPGAGASFRLLRRYPLSGARTG